VEETRGDRLEQLLDVRGAAGDIVGKSVFASGNRFFEAQLSEF